MPLGFALAIFTLDEGEVVLAGILPDARGQGHGLRLMQAVIEAARAAGLGRLFLEHAAENAAAERLYRELGFHQIGRRLGYYGSAQPSGARHDAVVLALDLAPPEPGSARRVDEEG